MIGAADAVRYLANATHPGNASDTLRHANTVDQIRGELASAAHSTQQVLDQLGKVLTLQADSPTIYDDRHGYDPERNSDASRGRAGHRRNGRGSAADAGRSAALLGNALSAAGKYTSHVGDIS